jgi:hypothetical protein
LITKIQSKISIFFNVNCIVVGGSCSFLINRCAIVKIFWTKCYKEQHFTVVLIVLGNDNICLQISKFIYREIKLNHAFFRIIVTVTLVEPAFTKLTSSEHDMRLGNNDFNCRCVLVPGMYSHTSSFVGVFPVLTW